MILAGEAPSSSVHCAFRRALQRKRDSSFVVLVKLFVVSFCDSGCTYASADRDVVFYLKSRSNISLTIYVEIFQ